MINWHQYRDVIALSSQLSFSCIATSLLRSTSRIRCEDKKMILRRDKITLNDFDDCDRSQ